MLIAFPAVSLDVLGDFHEALRNGEDLKTYWLFSVSPKAVVHRLVSVRHYLRDLL